MKHYESEVVLMKVFSLFQVFSQEQAKLNDLYENRQESLKKSISVFIPLSTAWFPLKMTIENRMKLIYYVHRTQIHFDSLSLPYHR